MAYSKCPHCNSNYFEISENTPSGSAFKLQFVQCSKCGNVVGVMEYYNTGALIEKLEKKIDGLSCRASGNTDVNIQIVNRNVTQLFNLLNKRFDDLEKRLYPATKEDPSN